MYLPSGVTRGLMSWPGVDVSCTRRDPSLAMIQTSGLPLASVVKTMRPSGVHAIPWIPSSVPASSETAAAFAGSPIGCVQIVARSSLRMHANDVPSGATLRPV